MVCSLGFHQVNPAVPVYLDSNEGQNNGLVQDCSNSSALALEIVHLAKRGANLINMRDSLRATAMKWHS